MELTRIIIILLLSISFIKINAQKEEYPFPSLSPKGRITQIVGNTSLEIEYERPSVRKRQIFGHLVPWNKVWRTGAGHCTKISFDKNVRVEGHEVQAGKYSLFTIPAPNEWIVILNRDTALYGSYAYDYRKDVARFIVLPNASNRFYETLNIDIEIIPNDARVFISWANIQVNFLIETGVDKEVESLIQNELEIGKTKDSDIYAGASEYLFYQGADLLNAIKLAEMAIELDENNGWARQLKIRIYEKLKLYDNALNEINIFMKHTQEREYENEAQRENTIKSLKSDYDRINKLIK